MKKIILLACLKVLFITCVLSNSVYAENNQDIITDLKVAGNKSLSGSAILAKVKVRKDDFLSQEILNEDIKRLYATGYFENVKVQLEPFKEGKRVIFQVQEKPILKEINIRENTVLRNKDILSEIASEPDTFLNPRILKSDINKIQQLYIEKGFPEVAVDYDIKIDEGTNKADVDIYIEEGVRLKIERIEVKGNKAYPDKKILKLIQTRRDTLFTSGLYKKSVMKEDMNRLISFYNNKGYLDAECNYTTSKIGKKNKIIVVIKIDEGKKYITGDIQIEGNSRFSVSDIKKPLSMLSGEIFTHLKLKRDISNIQSFYFDKGYIFTEVKADTMLNPDTGKIDIRYNIKEGDVAYIDKIDIRGNTKTKDIVIRRELEVYPGEEFDGKKLRDSKRELDYLGIFQSVNFDVEPGTAANRKNLVVDVKVGQFL